MEKVELKNLPKGHFKACMVHKKKNMRPYYLHEKNEQFQDDGIEVEAAVEVEVLDDDGETVIKMWETCVDLSHATTFATIEGEEEAVSDLPAEDKAGMFQSSLFAMIAIMLT